MAEFKAPNGGYLFNAEQFHVTKDVLGRTVVNAVEGVVDVIGLCRILHVVDDVDLVDLIVVYGVRDLGGLERDACDHDPLLAA